MSISRNRTAQPTVTGGHREPASLELVQQQGEREIQLYENLSRSQIARPVSSRYYGSE
jgi:hypothetical protein